MWVLVWLLMFTVPQSSSVMRNGIFTDNRGSVRTMDVTQDDLLDLIYGEDEIPNFELRRQTQHPTYVNLHVGGDKPQGRMYSKIIRHWSSHDGFSKISMEGWVYESPQIAREALSYAITGNTVMNSGSLFGDRIGDECWSSTAGPARVFFALGRVIVKTYVWTTAVHVNGKREILGVAHDLAAETLAYGLEYRLRNTRKFLAKNDSTVRFQVVTSKSQGLSAIAFNNVTWVPISVLESIGGVIEWDQSKQTATVSYHGRKIVVRPFRREFQNGDKLIALKAPVLLSEKGPIVPLEEVAKALGIKIKTVGKNQIMLERIRKG